MAEKKYYVLRNKSGDTEHVFSGSSPRQAALKAATR
ncbi:MAG: non-histone chromosomal MC1 family protein, partial [archaeon]|nr:non-histone chromosomal MC1 family protein [archaeon]